MTILPLVKRMGAKLVSMTGKPNSTLARAADVHLDVSVDEEACPLNLAPTASTTATLRDGRCIGRRAARVTRLHGGRLRDVAPEWQPRQAPAVAQVQDIMHTGDEIPKVDR